MTCNIVLKHVEMKQVVIAMKRKGSFHGIKTKKDCQRGKNVLVALRTTLEIKIRSKKEE